MIFKDDSSNVFIDIKKNWPKGHLQNFPENAEKPNPALADRKCFKGDE